MKFSIVTVCYNAEDFIEGCLRSVANQTYRDIEHIVVDGLSSDGTVAIVQRYPHVSALICERDQGIYDAMNKGVGKVTGDYVLFLNADDTLASEDALEKAVAAIARSPGADVYYGSLEVRPIDGPAHIFHPPPPGEAPQLMICGCLPHQSTLARPSVFARTGGFDLRYRHHSDYDWFLKILADPAIDIRCLDVVIGSFRLGGISSQLATGQPEVYRIQNESPLFASAEWDRRRILAYQDALLWERLESGRLRESLRLLRDKPDAHESAEVFSAQNVGQPSEGPSWIIETKSRPARSFGLAMGPWLSRVRWRIIEFIVGLLPDNIRYLLRRVRQRR